MNTMWQFDTEIKDPLWINGWLDLEHWGIEISVFLRTVYGLTCRLGPFGICIYMYKENENEIQ